MAEEFKPETLPFRSAFNEARNVGNNKAVECTKVRVEGRKGVRPYFCPGTRERIEE
jgi:hypothetical protein